MATNSFFAGTGTAVATAAPSVGSWFPVTVASLQSLVTRSASSMPGTLTRLAKTVSIARVTSLPVVPGGRVERSNLRKVF